MKIRYLLTTLISLIQLIPLYSQAGTSDWSLFRGNADLSGRYDSNLPSSPRLLWSVSSGAGSESSPVISNGTIYFGNDKGTLTAVDANGKVNWKFETGESINAAPTIFDGKVIFGTINGILRAVNANSGKLEWTYKTDNEIAGSANVWKKGNLAGVIVGSYDYYLHCVDPETGKPRWKVETENFINGTPAISNGKIIFGGCDGIIRIVDPVTGIQKDTINIGIYIAGSPALSGDYAFLGDYDGNFYSLNLTERKPIWKIYPGDDNGSIMAIPAVGYGSVVIGSEDRNLYCYSFSDGRLKWKFRTNGNITGSAVITPAAVLFTSTDGKVRILNLDNGQQIWSFNAGAPISSSPAVSDNRFYIVTDDGRLLAFGK